MNDTRNDVLRPTDADAVCLAKTLLRTARFGAIAAIEPETGHPLVSRVGVATDTDGSPLILISMLAAHTRAVLADPRCSLMLGEPGKGDALAHPRLSLSCTAERLERETPVHERARNRYLNHNPKARLYADLGDFSLFRLHAQRASLNGGFGKAYALSRNDIILAGPAVESLAAAEKSAVEHMNEDHRDAIDLYARHWHKAVDGDWALTGIDPDGVNLARGDEMRRIFFPAPLEDARSMRGMLVDMAKQARAALGA